MNPELETSGAIVIALASYKLIEYLGNLFYNFWSKDKNKANMDSLQQTDIALLKQLNKIETNEIAHLNKNQETMKDALISISERMARVETKIDLLLKR